MNYKILWYVVIAGVVVNVLVLNWRFLSLSTQVEKQLSRQSVSQAQETQPDIEKSTEEEEEETIAIVGPSSTECPDCIKRIQSLEDEFDALRQTVETNQTTQSAPATNTFQGAREFFVPLGSGETSSDEWVDIQGASSYIDRGNYGSIDKVYFEGTLSIPTGQGRVYARLYNATDDHPVWFSEVTTETDEAHFFQSDNIVLENGNKLYKVQMKNTLGARSTIDSARVKILLQ